MCCCNSSGSACSQDVNGFKGEMRDGTWAGLVSNMGLVSGIDIDILGLQPPAGSLFRSCMPGGSYDKQGEVPALWGKIFPYRVISLISDEEFIRKTGWSPSGYYHNFERIQLTLWTSSDETIYGILQECLTYIRRGETIVAHCSGGVGRVGTFTCLLFFAGSGQCREDCIQAVKKSIPSAMTSANHIALFDRITIYIESTCAYSQSSGDGCATVQLVASYFCSALLEWASRPAVQPAWNQMPAAYYVLGCGVPLSRLGGPRA